MFDFNRGQSMISRAVASFAKVVTDLEKGIELCKEKVVKLDDEITKLHTEKAANIASVEKAEKVKQNIQKLLNE